MKPLAFSSMVSQQSIQSNIKKYQHEVINGLIIGLLDYLLRGLGELNHLPIDRSYLNKLESSQSEFRHRRAEIKKEDIEKIIEPLEKIIEDFRQNINDTKKIINTIGIIIKLIKENSNYDSKSGQG